MRLKFSTGFLLKLILKWKKGMKTCHSFATAIDSTEIRSLWSFFILTLAHSLYKVGLGLHMFYTFNKLTKPQFFPVISWAN